MNVRAALDSVAAGAESDDSDHAESTDRSSDALVSDTELLEVKQISVVELISALPAQSCGSYYVAALTTEDGKHGLRENEVQQCNDRRNDRDEGDDDGGVRE